MTRKLVGCALLTFAFLFPASQMALAHCDALDGPVVRAAQKALETGNLNSLLIWVPAASESELREAFTRAREVRALNARAREFADHYFFETAVRIHRAGEGEAYTGLKAAGHGITPAMRAADQALEGGNADKLEAMLLEGLRHEFRRRFASAIEKKKFAEANLAAGREFVQAYIQFLHMVEVTERLASERRHE